MRVRPAPVDEGLNKGRDRGLNFSLLIRQMNKYLPAAVGPGILGLLSSVLFTRWLTSGEYGQFTLVTAGAALGAALCSQWLQQAIGRYLPREHAAGKSADREAIALSLLLIVVTIIVGTVLAALIASAVAHNGALLVASFGLLMLTTVLFGTLTTVLQSDLAAGRYSWYQLGHAVLRFALAVTGILLMRSAVHSLIWAYALAPGLLVPTLWRDASLPPIANVWREWRRLIPSVLQYGKYGVPMLGWFLAANLLNVGDRYIIQWFRGTAEVGLYAANYSLITGAIGLLIAPVHLAAHPLLMRAWERGESELASRLLGQIVTSLLAIGIVSVGALALFSADVAALVLGPEFRAGHGVMPVVLGGLILWQLAMYAHKPLEFAGQTRMMMRYSMISVATNLLLNLVLIPFFGYAVAAATTAIAYGVYTGLCMRAGRQVLRWTVAWQQLVGVVAVSAVGFAGAGYARVFLVRWAGPVVGIGFELVVVALISLVLCARTLRPFFTANPRLISR